MRFFRLLGLSMWACVFSAHAGMPDYQTFPAAGRQMLLWVASERGRAEPEVRDMADWLRAAQDSGKQVTVYAVARAAVPLLRAAASLEAAERQRLCVMLMYPNLYTVAEPLAAPDYLDPGSLDGLRVRVLQPRRSAATPWLPGLLDHLALHGATVSRVILENLREGWWARETPTDFEIAESRRMDALLLRELNAWECK